MASEFEDALAAVDARLEKALKAAGGVVNGLKRVRRAARAGQVSEIVKGLEGLDARILDAQSAGRDLAGAWTFDTPSYMADGRFLADLEAAAAEQNLAMFERDGRIYCFPLILRIDANQSAVRIGRKIQRRIGRANSLASWRRRKRGLNDSGKKHSSISSTGPTGVSSGASGTGPTLGRWFRSSTFMTRSRFCRAPTIHARNSPAICFSWTGVRTSAPGVETVSSSLAEPRQRASGR